MNKLSKYLSLIKFSLFQPKYGIDLFQTYRQTNEDSKQTILPHKHSAMEIEQCLKSLFPNLDTKKEDLTVQTKKLGSDLQSFLEKIKKFEFPSKHKPYPTDYSILESSRLFLYALCKIIKPKIIVETGVAYGLSTSYILQALYENKTGTLYSIDSEFRPWESELMIGSAIPSELKTRWKFVKGSSIEKLNDLSYFVVALFPTERCATSSSESVGSTRAHVFKTYFEIFRVFLCYRMYFPCL